jgi:hypothetical protein
MKKVFALGILGCAAMAALGCQTYDFEPVEPLAIAQTTQPRTVAARSLRPNLLLVVDTSGSMLIPANPAAPECQVGGVACGINQGQPVCPSNCPTRLSEMKVAMNSFLGQFGSSARVGMVYFPRDNNCVAATTADIDIGLLPPSETDDPAAFQAQATQVNTAIQALTAQGGTPTGTTLQAMSAYERLGDPARKNFILLLTDGLPNCNRANSNYQTAACACTSAPVGGVDQCNPGQSLEAEGCLDRSATVSAVASLRTIDIQTIVIGFGTELAGGDGPNTLQAMAEAGGFATTYFRATNGAELATQLFKIGGILDDKACETTLEVEPSDPGFLTVLVNGIATPSGPDTWIYNRKEQNGVFTPVVTFQGALCERLKASTLEEPIELAFRIVETL